MAKRLALLERHRRILRAFADIEGPPWIREVARRSGYSMRLVQAVVIELVADGLVAGVATGVNRGKTFYSLTARGRSAARKIPPAILETEPSRAPTGPRLVKS